MSDQQEYKKLSREELEELVGEELPERAAMSLVNANIAIPINAAVAANVLSDGAIAYADAAQTTPHRPEQLGRPDDMSDYQKLSQGRARQARRRGAARAGGHVADQRQRRRADQRRGCAERRERQLGRICERDAETSTSTSPTKEATNV